MSTEDKQHPTAPAPTLRQKAEAHFREREAGSSENIDDLPPESMRTILHELRVHQIELEMQNEELLRAQADLDASRARYFDLYDLAPAGYITVSEAGLILEANLTAATLLGMNRGALVKQPVTRFLLKEDQDIFYKCRRQLLETGEAQHCELRMVRSDGTAAWTHMQSTTAQNEAGAHTCRVVISDISARREAEESLRAANEHLGNLFSYSNASIIVWDTQLRVTSVNRAFASLVGKKASEIHGSPLESLFPPDFVADSMGMIKRTLSGERWEAIELRLLHRDGSIRTVLWNSATVFAADGKTPKAVIAQGQDITKRKRAEKELRASEAKVRAITESAQDAILMMDPDGLISYWNPAAESIFGYRAEEAIGKNLHELLVPEPFLSAHRAAYPEFQRTGQGHAVSKTVEMSARRKDGQEIAVSLSMAAVTLNGEWHSVGIVRNITQRKAMEANLNDALAHAEAGNRAKSEFLGIMSHELRTPLNGVLGFAELLADTPLDEEQKSLVETVSKCGERLLAIVKDILDFSSMEAGKLAIHVAPVAVADLVKAAADTVRKAAAEKGLELRCEVGAGVPGQITGDEQRIRQILINILGNAVKFTSGGSVDFRVAPDAESRFLDFSVEDTGIGISSETSGLLFKPFTQVDSTSARAFGGTGLGLAISKRLADAMGGSITVASIPGKGSAFTFHLPLEPAPVCAGGIASMPFPVSDQERNKPALAEPPVQTGGTPPEGNLVLVVEDDRANSTLAGKMLQGLGYRAEFASDGAEALKAFVPGKFSAILMDVVMPGVNGVTATKMIREIEAATGGHVPIIALTANVLPGHRERCLAVGMDDFLAKPFKKAELAAKLACIPKR